MSMVMYYADMARTAYPAQSRGMLRHILGIQDARVYRKTSDEFVDYIVQGDDGSTVDLRTRQQRFSSKRVARSIERLEGIVMTSFTDTRDVFEVFEPIRDMMANLPQGKPDARKTPLFDLPQQAKKDPRIVEQAVSYGALADAINNVRGQIVDANRGLIYAMIQKKYSFFIGAPILPNDETIDDEVLAQGIDALYDATRSFRLDSGWAFSTYASGAIHRRLGRYCDQLKKQYAMRRLPSDRFLASKPETADPISPLQFRRMLETVIKHLPRDQARVMKLKFGFGTKRTNQVVGEELGMCQSAVADLVCQAQELIRSYRIFESNY